MYICMEKQTLPVHLLDFGTKILKLKKRPSTTRKDMKSILHSKPWGETLK